MNIGRIISNKENIDTLDFVDVTKNIGSIDNFIPTLIIGKKKAEEIYGKENIPEGGAILACKRCLKCR